MNKLSAWQRRVLRMKELGIYEEYKKIKNKKGQDRRKLKYETDEEYRNKVRERDAKRKRNRNEKQRIRARENQRRHYNSDPNGAKKQNERRRIREPNRIIRAASDNFSKGDLSIDALLERLSEALAYADNITVKKPGRRRKYS